MAPAPSTAPSPDVVIVGGGHNALTAAACLARAGLAVTVLERAERTGGAAVSTQAFAGLPARLSRYSYLVSLMPERLMAELDLDVRLISRDTASYTPWTRAGRDGGLLVERPETSATAEAFAALTGSSAEYDAWRAFYAEVEQLAGAIAPTLLRRLPRASEVSERVPAQIWRDVVEQPLGRAIERRFADDTVRGIVATDALIGTFASMLDASLVQNRCFLYHLIGNGTGEWRVPVGGMGAVTDALAAAAAGAGARLVTGAEVVAIETDGDAARVRWRERSGREHAIETTTVLAGVAPTVLQRLLGRETPADAVPEGSQLKINLLLDRLPRLRSGADPRAAFAGTLHLNEEYSRLEAAHAQAAAGRVPDELPGEVYCHSLSDPSILGDLAQRGMHTLTYFGLHTPAGLFRDDADARQTAIDRALASIDRHLEEPIRSCLARDADGAPCIEVKTPLDVEADLAMPGGHIFHGDLAWPWAPEQADLSTPAAAWGVATDVANVLLCGSGARRGGAVSGIGGHNAAMAVLESR